MASTIFFGTLYPGELPGTSSTTVNAQMSLVPAPDTGMEAGTLGYAETIEYENGGGDVVSSPQTRKLYQMDWNLREAAGAQGLDIVSNYQQKLYGPGLIYWSNPMIWDQNLFFPAFASPGLIEQGFKSINPDTPTFVNTTANGYSHPKRSALFNITTAANTPPTGANTIQVIVIPPTQTLWIGFTGMAVTGNSQIVVRPINQDGSYAATVSLALNLPTSATRLTNSFSGTTYKAVEVYFTRTSAVASTITATSAMAQLWPTGFSPVLTGSHIHGQGDSGCKFTTAAKVESYTLVAPGQNRHLKGMSADLMETGAWVNG